MRSIAIPTDDIEMRSANKNQVATLPDQQAEQFNNTITNSEEKKMYGHEAAIAHIGEHKYKYGLCTSISIAAIVIGCVLGITAAVVASTSTKPSALTQATSAVKGTALKAVSAMPSKETKKDKKKSYFKQSTSFLSLKGVEDLLGYRLFATPDPSNFPLLSDYNVEPVK